MTADEMIEVIQAWKNGKEIERQYTQTVTWKLVEKNHEFDFRLNRYRIKPAAIAAGRNPEKLTTEQIKGYRCLSEEEFDGLKYNSLQPDIYYYVDGFFRSCGEESNRFYKGTPTTYFTDKPEGYFLPKQEPEKPYWSKPEDVPMDVDWMRHKERKVRVRISAVYTHAITCFGIGEIRFEEIKDYETWDGTEWKECRCESI